jgi:hypothetical protein
LIDVGLELGALNKKVHSFISGCNYRTDREGSRAYLKENHKIAKQVGRCHMENHQRHQTPPAQTGGEAEPEE